MDDLPEHPTDLRPLARPGDRVLWHAAPHQPHGTIEGFDMERELFAVRLDGEAETRLLAQGELALFVSLKSKRKDAAHG